MFRTTIFLTELRKVKQQHIKYIHENQYLVPQKIKKCSIFLQTNTHSPSGLIQTYIFP